MQPYPKIENLFNRDMVTNKITVGDYRSPVFATIDPWIVTEKIDGTNIRIDLRPETARSTTSEWEPDKMTIGGRTDRAQIPANLYGALQEMFDVPKLQSIRQVKEDDPNPRYSITLYGEGYGAGIQKAGVGYRPDPSFILFDVLVEDKWWLAEHAVSGIAYKLGVDRVPILGVKTRYDIVDLVRSGNYKGNLHEAPEGVVCRPIEPLFDRRGHRVMFKLKGRDF